MFDPEFKMFYDDVKSPSWPDVSDYREFLALPSDIKTECFDTHRLQSRLDEICSPEYWINQTTDVFAKNNVAFVPVPKCAQTYYISALHDAGWRKIKTNQLDVENTHFFGVLMHPLKRYLKGITQQLIFQFSDHSINSTSDVSLFGAVDWKTLDSFMETKYFRRFISLIAVGDTHSMPYHLTFGNFLKKVYWIPSDFLNLQQVNKLINDFISSHHQPTIDFSLTPLHQSSKKKTQLYEKIVTNFFDNPSQIYIFYKVFGPDLKLYYKLLNHFSDQVE